MFEPSEALKKFFPSPSLIEGSEFKLGLDDLQSSWQVRQIRLYLGIPHALIEQRSTGQSKTLAVSAILRDRTFHLADANGA